MHPTIFEFERFVRFHQPFVVQKSHPIWSKRDFSNFLLETSHLVNSIPCDVQTNILTASSTSLNRIFDQTIANLQSNSQWFLAFRNCDFAATKSTRPLWPRPSFVPLHLRPHHTNWLVIASEYPAVDLKTLELRGLVMVAQLTGRRVFQLMGVGAKCARICQTLTIELWAGETLVFLADKWRVRYEVSERFKGDGDFSVTYVAEFDWDESRW